jgi:hypothetical protein
MTAACATPNNEVDKGAIDDARRETLGCHDHPMQGQHEMIRRLRALAGLAALWAIPWALLGAILGARFVLIDRAPLVLIPVLSAICAVYGVFIGLAFGLVIAAVARARPLERVSVPLSALVVAAVAFILGARAEPGYGAAVLFAVFGAMCAAASLRIARTGAQAT